MGNSSFTEVSLCDHLPKIKGHSEMLFSLCSELEKVAPWQNNPLFDITFNVGMNDISKSHLEIRKVEILYSSFLSHKKKS